MSLNVFILKEWLSNTKYLIMTYEQMPSHFITDESREVTINDLKKLQKGIEEEIEILTKNNG